MTKAYRVTYFAEGLNDYGIPQSGFNTEIITSQKAYEFYKSALNSPIHFGADYVHTMTITPITKMYKFVITVWNVFYYKDYYVKAYDSQQALTLLTERLQAKGLTLSSYEYTIKAVLKKGENITEF